MGRTRASAKDLKQRFTRWLKERFFLRVHMTLILATTFFAGLLATRMLLAIHLNVLWFRYVLAVVLAYAVFLFLIRLWLIYLGIWTRRERAFSDSIDLGNWSDFGSFGRLDSGASFGGGGGRFGGGGATGSWGEADVSSVAATTSSGSGGGGGGSGWSFDLGDADDLAIVVLFLLLVAAILAAGIYLIYAAPAILSEAAFEAILASALVRGAKRVDQPNWVGSVMKATAWPLLVVLLISGVLGWYAQKRCPSAVRLRDAINCNRR